jgi:(1->4)-alpha-D-glucan 1-alpha-D-glucosylmutase
MSSPISTYRVQLSPSFTLEDLGKIIDYLEQLQVDTVYAAPFFQAKEGSTHGYDVSDPFVINKAIGDLEGFRKISDRLKSKGMGWLQDIVPNHMANHPTTPWIYNMLELGPDSPYYRYFDINWESKDWKGQVMVPVLGTSEEEVLAQGEIQLKFSPKGFSLAYYENEFPLSAASYPFILSQSKGPFSVWEENFTSMGHAEEQWERHKSGFIQALKEDQALAAALDDLLEKINSNKHLLQQLLERQHYKLVYWKESEKKINFRRFFTINDLICLRMEDAKVFEDYHAFIFKLCEEGLFSGLRIDHIDGLFDPVGYMEKLREKVGDDLYIVIEKILESEEKLPQDWPIQGTSGYEFLALVNNLFTASKNKEKFKTAYQALHPHQEYEDLVYEKKTFILHERMGGELQNLCDLIMDDWLWQEGMNPEEGKQALSAFLAAFPIYRIYARSFPLTGWEQSIIEKAYQGAVGRNPELAEQLAYLRELLLGKTNADADKALFFLQRCQQFTGPLAAKGVEDTLFYNYNLLISHNEVGDSPQVFGVSADGFHRLMIERQGSFPRALSATATHDTKRGEDARMRINVLSEIPEEWFGKVEEWRQINQSVRKSESVPDPNEEYFIYQMLLGAMAFEEEDEEGFLQRTLDYLQKVLREAKTHTFWSDPDEAYEQEVADFVKNILQHAAFRKSFDPFKDKMARYGAFYSLGQTLIKLTAPGIPDIYQGTELWDLSYVDPDNRRPVDYPLRQKYLEEMRAIPDQPKPETLRGMLSGYVDGKIKMYTLFRALKERKANPFLFEQGDYIPVNVTGEYENQVLTYARRYQDRWVLVAVPLGITSLALGNDLALNIEALANTILNLPENAPKEWRHVYTGETFSSKGQLGLTEIFASYPVVLLKST